jgi:methyl-accepting chemotaxis protein
LLRELKGFNMSWFKNLKIGHKIAVSFGVVLACIVALSGLSFLQINSLKQEVNSLYNDSVKGTAAIGGIQQTLTDQRLVQLRWLAEIEAGDGAKSDGNQKLEALQKQLDENVTAYEKSISDPDDQKQFDSLKTLLVTYKSETDKVRTALAKGDDTQASTILTTTSREIFVNQVQPEVQKIVDWNVDYAQSNFNDANQIASGAITSAFIATAFAIIFSVGIGILFHRLTVPPLHQVISQLKFLSGNCVTDLSNSVAALRNGDLTMTVTPKTTPVNYQSQDEVGELAATFNSTLSQFQGVVHDYTETQKALQKVIATVDQQADTVAATSNNLANNSEETAIGARDVAQTMDEVSRAVQETSNTSDQIAQAAEQLAMNAQEAATEMASLKQAVDAVRESGLTQRSAAEKAAEIATQGGTAVSATIASMSSIESKVGESTKVVRELGEKQAQIGSIVQTIEDIAAQTNLLALNAAIEAARAGEHGRGFAVVAEEVRKLAERCGDATKEIASLIASVSDSVEQAIQSMDESASEVATGTEQSDRAQAALTEILGSIQEVLDLATTAESLVTEMDANASRVEGSISNVASVSEESAAGAQELNATAEEMAASAEEVTASVQQQTANIEQINNLAENLSGSAQDLKKLVAQFKYNPETSSNEIILEAA